MLRCTIPTLARFPHTSSDVEIFKERNCHSMYLTQLDQELAQASMEGAAQVNRYTWCEDKLIDNHEMPAADSMLPVGHVELIPAQHDSALSGVADGSALPMRGMHWQSTQIAPDDGQG